MFEGDSQVGTALLSFLALRERTLGHLLLVLIAKFLNIGQHRLLQAGALDLLLHLRVQGLLVAQRLVDAGLNQLGIADEGVNIVMQEQVLVLAGLEVTNS